MQPMRTTARQRWFALGLLSVVEFMLLLDTAIINIATPAIEAGLRIPEADVSWIQNAYILVFGGFLLLGGRAADLFGRRRFYLLGLGLFTLSSLLAGLAMNETTLLAARGLQGLGAAMVLPAEQSLLVTIFTDKEEFNRAMGIWGAVGGAGGLFGILLGGVITQLAGWPWIFLINAPIGVVAVLLSLRSLPESRGEGEPRLDLAGALTSTLAIVLIAYAPIVGQERDWGSPVTIGALVAAALLLVAFVVIEARAKAPLVPLRFFRLRNTNGANVVSFLVGAAHAPMFFLLSLYFQQGMRYDAFTAGLAILPIAVATLPVSFLLLPRALEHLGPRGTLATGMFLLAGGIALFARMPLPSDFVRDVLPASLFVAIGLPFSFAGVNIVAVTAVDPSETGLASGLMNTAQRVGSGIGISALLAVFVMGMGTGPAAFSPTHLAVGFRDAFIGAGVFALLGAVLTLTMIKLPKQALAPAGQPAEPAEARKFSFHH